MNSIKERKLHSANLNQGLDLALASAGADLSAHNYLLMAANWFEMNAKCDATNAVQDRFLAALAYYVAGHYAQAYVIFRDNNQVPRPNSAHSLLRRLFAKELTEIEDDGRRLLSDPAYVDEVIADNLASGLITEDDSIERAIIASMHMAFLDVCAFVQTGDPNKIDNALGLLDTCYQIAEDLSLPQTENYSTILRGAKAMLVELRNNSIWTQLDEMRSTDDSGLVQRYVELAVKRSPPFVELWPSQVVAIPKINEGSPGKRPNFLIKMPTSAGKTKIAELSILRFLMDFPQGSDKKCIYIAPFHALGSQIESTLQKNFLPLGVGVSDLYGGFEISPTDRFLFDQQRILVATPEKVDALLRYNPDFASQIGLIFIDEGHLIEEPDRGLRFEMLIHRLVRRYAHSDSRLILASAVLGQTDSLVQWITGTGNGDGLQTSNFRPTRNYLGLLSWDGKKAMRQLTHVSDEIAGGYVALSAAPTDIRVRALPKVIPQMPLLKEDSFLPDEEIGFPSKSTSYEPVVLAALREAQEGMTLVYVSRVSWLEPLAEAVFVALDHIAKCRNHQVPINVLELQKPRLDTTTQMQLERCIDLAEELTGAESLISRSLKIGFVVHYGGIPARLRNSLTPLIEQGVFNLVIATSTVIHGVNTPVKTVIIHSIVRGKPGDWQSEISSREFMNLVGRAGRAMQETEGIALLFTHADKSNNARASIRRYVKSANADELKSALRAFLNKVIGHWREIYPFAGVGELCENLASEHIDWLDDDANHQLDDLDRELLALLQESDNAALTVEDLFERSLLALQSAGDNDLWHGQQTSLSLLAARVEYLRKIPPAVRYAYYRSGLSIKDCRILESSAEALLAMLDTLGQVREYSAAQVASILFGLYQDFLVDLSIFRKVRASVPMCAEQILSGWLEGMRIDAIADLPDVTSVKLSRSDVTKFIDEFCATLLPWALNAVRGYVASIAPSPIVDDWLTIWSSMIHFGLPTTKAAVLYGLGLRSREASIWCAEHCEELAESSKLVRWMVKLDDVTIHGWQLDDHIQQEVITFRNNLRLSFMNHPSSQGFQAGILAAEQSWHDNPPPTPPSEEPASLWV